MRFRTSPYVSRPGSVFLLCGFFMLLIALLVFSSQVSPHAFDSDSSITITAVGDLGSSNNTKKVLNAMQQVKPRAHLLLGDFMYDSVETEAQWCDFVYQYLGSDKPIAIVSGNHESDGTAGGGMIDNFVDCMPKVPYTGVYGKDYFIDIPTKSPLARVFMISPGLHFSDGDRVYTKGSYWYEWLSAEIDNARIQGVPWIIVGMHKNCLAVTKDRGCDIGEDVQQLLIDKKVDLTIQAHEHLYGRSAQMTCFSPDEFLSGCTNSGWDSVYTKGNGLVTVIAGTGGRSLYAPDVDKSSIKYFKELQGYSMDSGFGFLKLNISRAKVEGSFVSENNDVMDHFIIRDNK